MFSHIRYHSSLSYLTKTIMSDQDENNCIRIQFGPWLIAQISSGKYPGLEWIDEDTKTMFKIPWTKINYPMWEEHHKIFEAWAVYRGKNVDTTTNLERSVSQAKSNFRTILRKCVEIEEVEHAHQLGLQMGNYKVYRILSKDETIAKRKSQQQTRQAYKWLKRMEDEEEKHGTVKDLLNGDGAKFFDIIAKTKRKSKKTKLKAFVANRRKQQVEAVSEPQASAFNMQEDSSTRSISTQTYLSDTTDVTFVLDPAAYEETAVSEMDTTPSLSSSLHSSVSTQASEQASTSETSSSKSEPKVIDMTTPTQNNLDGFQMLLQAAQMAEGHMQTGSNSRDSTPANRNPSVVDILVELKIPPEELFAYEMSVRYEARSVMEKTTLSDMNYGYRIYYGNKDHVKNLDLDRPEFSAFKDDFARTPISLPESHVLPGNSLYTVLKNISGGLVLKSDQKYVLTAKRLCLSRIYTFTSYGETPADKEPMLLTRNEETVLFSYKKFLSDWHRFLIDGSPRPSHEINFAFGKKTKHRHSRVFVAVTLVPKAADSMLRRIAENMDEKTLDNVLKLFSNTV